MFTRCSWFLCSLFVSTVTYWTDVLFNTLNNVGCRGNEINLDDCTHSVVGVHNCDHGQDAGVIWPPPGSIVGATVALMLYVTPLSPSYVCPELYRCWQFLVSMPYSVSCFNSVLEMAHPCIANKGFYSTMATHHVLFHPTSNPTFPPCIAWSDNIKLI